MPNAGYINVSQSNLPEARDVLPLPRHSFQGADLFTIQTYQRQMYSLYADNQWRSIKEFESN